MQCQNRLSVQVAVLWKQFIHFDVMMSFLLIRLLVCNSLRTVWLTTKQMRTAKSISGDFWMSWSRLPGAMYSSGPHDLALFNWKRGNGSSSSSSSSSSTYINNNILRQATVADF